MLQVIADFTGLNIITSDTVTGSLTLRLKDIPWDQALDIILQTKGLDMRKNGNVVLIAPREELALKEKQQLEAQQQISELEPLQHRVVPAQLHQGGGSPEAAHDEPQQQFGSVPGRRRPPAAGLVLSKRGIAVVDPRTNILFVQDTGVAARGSAQDHPADRRRRPPGADRGAHRDRRRQVQPPARRALRHADRRSRSTSSYAVGMGGSLGTQPVGQHRLAATDAHPRHAHADAVRARVGHRHRRATRIRRSSTSTCRSSTPAGQLALTLINLGSGNLINLELSALEADNRGKVVSSPRVVTADNQKAQHRAGHRNPVRHARQRRTTRRPCSSRRPCCAWTSRRRSRPTTASS